jgi:hypothetical protein
MPRSERSSWAPSSASDGPSSVSSPWSHTRPLMLLDGRLVGSFAFLSPPLLCNEETHLFPLPFFPSSGYTVAICCCLASTAIFCLGGWLHKREELDRARRGLADNDFDTPGSGSIASPVDNDDARSIKKEEHEHVEYATNQEYINPTPADRDTRHFDQADRK